MSLKVFNEALELSIKMGIPLNKKYREAKTNLQYWESEIIRINLIAALNNSKVGNLEADRAAEKERVKDYQKRARELNDIDRIRRSKLPAKYGGIQTAEKDAAALLAFNIANKAANEMPNKADNEMPNKAANEMPNEVSNKADNEMPNEMSNKVADKPAIIVNETDEAKSDAAAMDDVGVFCKVEIKKGLKEVNKKTKKTKISYKY